MHICISAPYPESAALALARSASRTGDLNSIFLPSRAALRKAALAASAFGLSQPSLRLSRGTSGIPELVEVAPSLGLLRLLERMPIVRKTVPSMSRRKHAFDTVVAGKISSRADVVVAMPEAAESLFRRASTAFRVFHAVDGHPIAHNNALDAVYGKERAKAEFRPPSVIARIERELELSSLVICPSTNAASQMTKYGVEASKVVVHPYGVDTADFSPASERVNEQPSVVYVGQISLRKGIPILLEAARRSKVKVLLAGPIVDKTLLDDMPPSVAYLGVLPHGQLATLLNSVDAFVFPTLEDSFGLVVPEAVATGLPIITTREAGAIETIDPRDRTIVEPGSVTDLARALQEVEPLDPSSRARRALRFRSHVGKIPGVHDWTGWSASVLHDIRSRLGFEENDESQQV